MGQKPAEEVPQQRRQKRSVRPSELHQHIGVVSFSNLLGHGLLCVDICASLSIYIYIFIY